jgi:glycosyltransferase involved in cell wall biosynthesis
MAETMLPKVSVIIPVYNGTNYLREAIDSVLSQTYRNHELLVVDDGSSDGTWALIQSYGSSLHGIHKENGGVASALNFGIRQATGDYIAWLSHDDLFLSNKLERQVDFLKRFPQFKACYTDYYIMDENGKILGEIETPWYPGHEAIRILFGRAYINGSTMLIERHCFEKTGLFSEPLRYTQDTEMWLRLLRYFEIGRVPEKLGKWRFHPSQGSQSVHIHTREAQAMYQRVFEEFGIGGLFPEWEKSAHNPETRARAYIWFGDTMSAVRGWYDFADDQYRKSSAIYPSLKNPARSRRVVNWLRSVLRTVYRSLRHHGERILGQKKTPYEYSGIKGRESKT